MSLRDSAPLAQLELEDVDVSDESDSSGCTRFNRQKFTLNDYACSYIDNSAACSVMNTPQRTVRRPVTPKHLAASFDDDSSLTGSLHDLVLGFDSTVQHFTRRESDDTADAELVSASPFRKVTSNSKRDGTLFWSIITELPISENRDQENACNLEEHAAVASNGNTNGLSNGLATLEKTESSPRTARETNGKRQDFADPYGCDESDDELELQLDLTQWTAEGDSEAHAEQLTRTADEAINEIECMFDEQQFDQNESDAVAEFDPLANKNANADDNANATDIQADCADPLQLQTQSNGVLRRLLSQKDSLVSSLNARLVELLAERDELEFQKETFDRFIALLNEVEQASVRRRSVCANDSNEPAQASRREERVASAPKRRSFSIQGLSSLFTSANWSVLKSPSSASGSSCTSHCSMTQSVILPHTRTALTAQAMTPTPSALLSPVSTSVSVHDGLTLLHCSANANRHIPIPIPLACRSRAPTVNELQRLNVVLAAIRDDSAQVPALLADYILNVYAPRETLTQTLTDTDTESSKREHNRTTGEYTDDFADVEC